MMQSYHIKRIGHQGNEQKLMQNVKRYLKLIQQKRFQNVVAHPLQKKYKNEYGENSVLKTQDVDHTIDLQFGGIDDIHNMNPLDKSVNRSLGSQIAYLIKKFGLWDSFKKL